MLRKLRLICLSNPSGYYSIIRMLVRSRNIPLCSLPDHVHHPMTFRRKVASLTWLLAAADSRRGQQRGVGNASRVCRGRRRLARCRLLRSPDSRSFATPPDRLAALEAAIVFRRCSAPTTPGIGSRKCHAKINWALSIVRNVRDLLYSKSR